MPLGNGRVLIIILGAIGARRRPAHDYVVHYNNIILVYILNSSPTSAVLKISDGDMGPGKKIMF